ncbi:MAG: hypothetical protein ACREGH_01255, partial [Minisyncoccia bacterium]
MPQSAASGQYDLMVRVVNGQGVELGWDDVSLGIVGGGSMLTISNQQILDARHTLQGPLAGPTFAPGASPSATFMVANPAANAITAVPDITVYLRTEQGTEVAHATSSVITIPAHSDKKVTLSLPAQTTPESYLAKVVLLNAEGQPASGIVEFRYVVAGMSGKIQFISVSPAQNGQYCGALPLSVSYSGPADGATTTGMRLVLSAHDAKDGALGSTTQTLSSSYGIVNLSIPLSHCVTQANIQGTLTDSAGNTLDTYGVSFGTSTYMAAGIHTFAGNVLYLALAIIALLIAIAIYVQFRRGAIFFLALAILGTAAFFSFHNAATAYTQDQQFVELNDILTTYGPSGIIGQGPGMIYFYWNSPDVGSTVRPGDIIQDISFSYDDYICVNAADSYTLHVYWADANGNNLGTIENFTGADLLHHDHFEVPISIHNVQVPQDAPSGSIEIRVKLVMNAIEGYFDGTYYDGPGYYSIDNFDGYAQLQVDANQQDNPPPTASIWAESADIPAGDMDSIDWSSTNATACTGTGFSTDNQTSGSKNVSPTETTTYSVACSGLGGSANDSATVTVNNPIPTATLTANPTSITSGN